MNSKISIAKEKNISGVPFFEIAKYFIPGPQSSVNLENTIKSNLILENFFKALFKFVCPIKHHPQMVSAKKFIFINL